MQRGRPVLVHGRKWRAPEAPLNCGNSGTTARLLLGVLAGHRFEARVTGDASLRRRPMRRVTGPLTEMGATVMEDEGDCLPLTIRGGSLRRIRYESPVASAQVKTALLLAGLVGAVPVTVVEPVRSRDHTERMFQHLGFGLSVKGTEVSFTGAEGWPYAEPFELDIPGDASSSAFLVGAAILAEAGELLIESAGVNPTRVGYLSVLERMGARIVRENERILNGEPVADLVVSPSELRGTEVLADEVPGLIDEVPILAALASRACGETVFRSVGELRVKESDRLGLLASNLAAIGAFAQVYGEDLVVKGSDRPFSGRIDTARDHRLTMAFAVLGTHQAVSVQLSETGSAAISYPGFFQDLNGVVRDAK
jgi:3-phosphoshikimate 1-carboxyvinyltransferase